MTRVRLFLIGGGVVAGAAASASCSAILGADFNVVLDDAGPGSGGGSAVAAASNGSVGSSGTGGASMGCLPDSCVPETVSDIEDNPWGIAASGDWVYWASHGKMAADGAIKRVSVSAPAAVPITLVGSLDMPNQVAVDEGFVYWTSSEANAVYCASITGAVAPTLVAGAQPGPIGILVDAGSVYWTTNAGHVRKVPSGCSVDLGAEEDVASGLVVPALLAEKDDILFVTEYTTGGRVMQMKKAGAAGASKLVDGVDTPNGITVRGDDVCFATAIVHGGVYCTGLTAGAGEVTTIAADQNTPAGLTVDRADDTLYWANQSEGTIMKARLNAATPIKVADGQMFPNGVVVAGDYVYWTNYAPAGQGGSVMRVRIH
jgi:hypothetical protein